MQGAMCAARACRSATISISWSSRMDRIEQLKKFIEAQPDEPFPRYALALEKKSKGDQAGAAEDLKELLRRRPDYLAAYLMLGLLEQALGRPEDANETFRKGQD